MDSAVQATTLSPLHVARLERFTHITIDVLSTKLHTSVHVIYVATTEGLIKKISVLPRTQETCVVEVWQATPDPSVPIKSLQFLKETNSVYVATDRDLLKIPADHCIRHTSKDSCLNAMDPYCGWNERYETCSIAPESDPLDKYWRQQVTSCPILDAIIDGSWSSWSEWTPCIHRSTPNSDSTDHCLCQTRECNNPAPNNGGRPCTGPSIAVINCTVHGGWSDWSAWSACSATCGTAVKTRSRTCTNPAPAHGGRVCVGADRSEAFCAEIPPCPALPQDGGWSEWSEWSECLSPYCRGGYRKRVRSCNNPPPENGGQYCPGNDIEVDHCTDSVENKKVTHSPWITDRNETGEYRKRFKFTCKAQLNPSLIKVNVKEEICNHSSCISKEIEHPRWSPWSPWNECSVPCGGGLQNRTRHCEGRGCQGLAVQTKECNKHPCQGEWSCWSEWSPCNVTCGWGVKTRYRHCLTDNCTGPDREKQPCENGPCESPLGWSNWTGWSPCDRNNEQHRKRHCRTSTPGSNMCKGSAIETRMCLPDELLKMADIVAENTVFASVGGAFFYLFVGLVIGVLVGCISMRIYEKKKKITIPSSPHYMSPKQNPYISMPLQDRPNKKHSASTSNSLLNNVHNGTLKSMKYGDYESATLKRNSHALTNGHVKQDLFDDDKFYYD